MRTPGPATRVTGVRLAPELLASARAGLGLSEYATITNVVTEALFQAARRATPVSEQASIDREQIAS
jgi:hypothetical protein